MENICVWVEDRNCDGVSSWECSNCGVLWEFPNNSTPFDNDMHYCPKCGNKMIDQKFLEVVNC